MLDVEIINTDKAPSAIGSYSQAVSFNGVVYISGQIPLEPETMEVKSFDFEDQARQVFQNLKAICEASGGDLGNLLKITVLLEDLSNFKIVNRVMEQFFTAPFPARAAYEVSALPLGVAIEVDGIMAL